MAGRLAVESDRIQYATEYHSLERGTDRKLSDRLKIVGFNYAN